MPVYPQPNLDPNAAPWGQSVEERLAALEDSAGRKSQDDINVNKQQNSSAQVLTNQIASISSVVSQLTTVTNTLSAAANVQYQEMGAVTGFTGFYNGSRPSIAVTAVSGRIEIGYGGSLNGGDGYFCYSVVDGFNNASIISRESVQANPAQRVAVTGGASFTPSGYKNIVVNVGVGQLVRVSLELQTSQSFCYFAGGSLLVRGAL